LLENATILVFADDWGVHPSSAQHLFRRFLGRNRVVWFNTVGLRLPRPTLRDGAKVLRKLRAWSGLGAREAAPATAGGAVATDAGPRPEVVDLPLVPLPLGRAARAANARLLRRAVRTRLGGAPGDAAPVIVTTLPLTADLVRAIPGATFVYYMVDDYAGWPGLGGALVKRMDEDQAAGADLVVAASRALAALHAVRTRRPPEYLPHGVDVAHFAAARSLRDARRARGEAPLADAVFFGLLDERVDRRLLADLARARPNTRFALLGPAAEAAGTELAALPNLARFPAVPYGELPAALARFDAVLLPYVRGDFGARLSPLKAREAIAAGLPVVATEVPELRAVGAGVGFGASAAELATVLEAALAGMIAVPPAADLAADSWEARAERLSELLADARARAPAGAAP
jgi:glycosyltransferase involved in cell wall biosynthesis